MEHFVILLFYILGVLLSTVNSDTECQSARTEVTVVTSERIVYEWKIRKFNLLTHRNNEPVYSEKFHSENRNETWRLLFYPRGSKGSDGYVSLHLQLFSASKRLIEVSVELAILRANHHVVVEKSMIKIYNVTDAWGYPEFIKRSTLLTTDSPNHNEIIIRCTIKLPSDTVTSTFDATIFDSKETLADDFRSLFKEPALTDFTIIVGDKKFPTHKVILASRSPVFGAMFDRNMTEEIVENELLIENVEAAVINGMLEFIYTDQVSDIKNLASDLLIMADRYELEKLKVQCEKALYDGLSSENATDILIFAEKYHADKLKGLVIQYIAEHAHEVGESESFKKAELSSELSKELIKKLTC